MKHMIVVAALALVACGQPVMKNGDLQKELESQGYTKVLIQGKQLNCGRFGRGRHFLGTTKKGTKILGQICYKRENGKTVFKVDTNQELGQTATQTGNTKTQDVPNPWKK